MPTEVMAVVRDEMRAPLLGLEAMLDALASSPLSPEVSERMQGHSRVLARRVSLLIEDLAVVATADPRAIAMDLQPLDLDQQLGECAASFPDMVIYIEGDKGARVLGDALRVQQIFANLMRSAQRLSGRPVTIRVSTKVDYVSFRVGNAGPRDGFELGIVKILVDAHGGMTIDEVGASFTFTLPLATNPAPLPVTAP
jgi:signal transduction histidine kinase